MSPRLLRQVGSIRSLSPRSPIARVATVARIAAARAAKRRQQQQQQQQQQQRQQQQLSASCSLVPAADGSPHITTLAAAARQQRVPTLPAPTRHSPPRQCRRAALGLLRPRQTPISAEPYQRPTISQARRLRGNTGLQSWPMACRPREAAAGASAHAAWTNCHPPVVVGHHAPCKRAGSINKFRITFDWPGVVAGRGSTFGAPRVIAPSAGRHPAPGAWAARIRSWCSITTFQTPGTADRLWGAHAARHPLRPRPQTIAVPVAHGPHISCSRSPSRSPLPAPAAGDGQPRALRLLQGRHMPAARLLTRLV